MKSSPRPAAGRILCALALAACLLVLPLSGCVTPPQDSSDTTASDSDPSASSYIDLDALMKKITASLDSRSHQITGKPEDLESLGFDPEDIQDFAISYRDGDYGVGDVYIILPKEGEEHQQNVINSLKERKDERIRESASYDIYNSAEISENGVIFQQGKYQILLMTDDNDAIRTIIENEIPNDFSNR